jgi:hypothetical protein
LLGEVLCDSTYEDKSAFGIAYCGANHKPVVPSNQLKNNEDIVDALVNPRVSTEEEEKETKAEDKEKEKEKGRALLPKPSGLKLKTGGFLRALVKEKPSYILQGFAYSLMDYFQNNDFNMVYVTKKSDREIGVSVT